MARFNTTQSTISVTEATTLTYVLDKSTILLSGTAGYTLTLSTPVPFPGTIQSIYNSTGGNVTDLRLLLLKLFQIIPLIL
jgi:hypothetical protein